MANSSQKPSFDPTRFITSAANLTETDIDSCKRTDVPLQVPQRRLLSRSLSLVRSNQITFEIFTKIYL